MRCVDNRLVVARSNGDIASFNERGHAWHALDSSESLRRGLWPAWRPGVGEEITASTVAASSSLESGAAGETPAAIAGSETVDESFIGPGLPHYALWSPDGRRICYVVADGQRLVLKLWEATAETSRVIVSGAPLFSAWSSDSRWLAVHHGSQLSVVDTQSAEQTLVSNFAVGFRAPAWSDSGRLAWLDARDGSVEIREALVPDPAETVGTLNGGAVLAYRPRSDELTAALAGPTDSGAFAEVACLTPERRRLVKGPLVGFWWSPDGQRLMTLHPTFSGDGRFQLRLHDADGSLVRGSEGLIPAPGTATTLAFFDQYRLSHPVWSSDSRWFVLCASLPREGPAPSFSDRKTSRAWLWDAAAGGSPADLGEATFAAFNREEVNEG
jgi:hypothetical protein